MTEDFSQLTGFARHGADLFCEELPIASLAQQYGTPLYVYSHEALTSAALAWKTPRGHLPHEVFYAVKANSNIGLLSCLAHLGLGFDIVSGGELERVLRAGGDPSKVVFSGVAKTPAEIRKALAAGIRSFNVESIPELERIEEVAAAAGQVAPISVRVNPDIDAKTHPYISTGLKNNKFGVAFDQVRALYQHAKTLPHLRITGIDCHIGSQITSLEPFAHACDKMLDIVCDLRDHGITLDHIDFGGGLGVQYENQDPVPPQPADLIATVSEKCKARGFTDLTLYFEPGRSIVARAGVLVMKTEFLKPTAAKNFLIVDTGMNDMIRPALYQAQMAIEPVHLHDESVAENTWDIVGPICETGDFLGRARTLRVQAGDLLVMTGAGAYGMSMASNYNTRPRAAEVLVTGKTAFVLRERETWEDLFRHEHLPPHN